MVYRTLFEQNCNDGFYLGADISGDDEVEDSKLSQAELDKIAVSQRVRLGSVVRNSRIQSYSIMMRHRADSLTLSLVFVHHTHTCCRSRGLTVKSQSQR